MPCLVTPNYAAPKVPFEVYPNFLKMFFQSKIFSNLFKFTLKIFRVVLDFFLLKKELSRGFSRLLTPFKAQKNKKKVT